MKSASWGGFPVLQTRRSSRLTGLLEFGTPLFSLALMVNSAVLHAAWFWKWRSHYCSREPSLCFVQLPDSWVQHHSHGLFTVSCSAQYFFITKCLFWCWVWGYFTGLKGNENVLVLLLFAFTVSRRLLLTYANNHLTDLKAPCRLLNLFWYFSHPRWFYPPHCENVITVIPFYLTSSFPECSLHEAISHL